MSSSAFTSVPPKFIEGLKTGNRELLSAITTEDVVWSIPGQSTVSGEAHGVEGIMARSHAFKNYVVNLEVLHFITGYNGAAIMLHNTSNHDGRVLDEYLTTVCHFRGDRVYRFDTYISDVKMLNEFFI